MTQDEIELVQGTADVLMSVGDRVADAFYARLFEIAPETRALFPDDLRRQKLKLVETLAALVGHLSHQDLLKGHLQRLGRHHALLGVEAAQYGPVGEALLFSLGEVLKDRFTGRVRAAWAALYGEVAAAMQGVV